MSSDDNDKDLVLDDKQKWILSMIAALMFVIISSPTTYKYVELGLKKVLKNVNITAQVGCPNDLGLLLHGLVFFLVFRLVLL